MTAPRVRCRCRRRAAPARSVSRELRSRSAVFGCPSACRRLPYRYEPPGGSRTTKVSTAGYAAASAAGVRDSQSYTCNIPVGRAPHNPQGPSLLPEGWRPPFAPDASTSRARRRGERGGERFEPVGRAKGESSVSAWTRRGASTVRIRGGALFRRPPPARERPPVTERLVRGIGGLHEGKA